MAKKTTNTNTYVFHVGIVFGPASMTSSPATSADYDNIKGTIQHIDQNSVPRTKLGEIKASRTMKFFQIAEPVVILWIRTKEKSHRKRVRCLAYVKCIATGLFSSTSSHHSAEPLACTCSRTSNHLTVCGSRHDTQRKIKDCNARCVKNIRMSVLIVLC
jgi:hypothetical protein